MKRKFAFHVKWVTGEGDRVDEERPTSRRDGAEDFDLFPSEQDRDGGLWKTLRAVRDKNEIILRQDQQCQK